MNTDQLRCFLTVAEYLNFTKAAEHLHVTHPAVSQQIRNLEKELGTTLFERSTRSVKLTETGHIFLSDARQMLEIAGRARRRFTNPEDNRIDILNLGTNNFPSLFRLTDALAALHQSHPSLHPRLHVIPFQHIFRRLDDGDLDAVICFHDPLYKRSTFTALCDVPMVCLCPTDHPLASATALCLDDLRQTPLVVLSPPHTTLPIVTLQGNLMGERPLSDIFLCDSVEAATTLVRAGYGITVLPALLAPQAPHLSAIPINDTTPVSFGIYHRSLDEKPLLSAFIQEMRNHFS